MQASNPIAQWHPPPRWAIHVTRPAYFLTAVWIFHILLFAVGPLEYRESVRMRTWAVILAGIGVFWVGEAAARNLKLRRSARIRLTRLERTVVIMGLIGVIGGMMLAIDKIFLSGLDFSQGLATMRFTRDLQVYDGIGIDRSPLLYVGYPIFSFSYTAIMLFVLYAEELKGWPATIGQLSILSPIFYAIIYASRWNLLILFYQLMGIVLVRWLFRRRLLPKVHGFRWKAGICIVLFVIYSNFTWSDRRSYSRVDRYESFQTIAREGWQVITPHWLDEMVANNTISPELAMNAISYTHYSVHSFIMLNRLVESHEMVRPLYGIFQIGILSPLVRTVFPEAGLLPQMMNDLREAKILGFYISAWGAMYMDWGLLGSVMATFFWGLSSGVAYHKTILYQSTGAGLFLAALLGSTLVTPMNSPIGMSNSFLIFVAHGFAVWMLAAPSSSTIQIAPMRPVRS